MTAPRQDVETLFLNEEQEKTYSQWLDQLHCTCPAGAQIRPSSLPSATIDLGDIIADHTRVLSSFTSAYNVVVVVIKMINCMIEVLCCLTNPFCLIFAIIRLFSSCLPDFILLFPQLAVPAIIICVIKIILAMIEYILTVLLPLIREVIENIEDLIDAFSDENQDAITAIAFKLAALIKELYNVLGILAVLGALWTMIKALLSAGIAFPCGGSGGACSECGDSDEICPTTLQQTSLSGTDGQFIILFGSDGFSFQVLFYSASRKSNFLQIRRFFPRGLDYAGVKDEDDVPYILNITQPDGSISKYMVASVDSWGYSTLYQLPTDYLYDGYLTNTEMNGLPFIDPLDARFNTKTETFTFSLGAVDRYITMQDTRGAFQSYTNGGSWKIQSKYDAYNVLLKRTDGSWDYGAPNEHIRWKLEPAAPTVLNGLRFELEINHEELIRHGLIGVGCHPAVQATKTALKNRFPDMANLVLPTLPDFDILLSNINSCISKVAPIDVDSQYILDNYQTIATEIVNLNGCITSTLDDFKSEAEDYAKQIYPIIFDPEASADGYYFSVTPETQIVGQYSNIELIPFDRNGGRLGVTVPPGIVEVDFETNFGTLSPVEIELDGYDPTGSYISSLNPGVATITARVGGRDVAYFDGYGLVAQKIYVEFVTAEESRSRATAITGEVSIEPVGRGRGA
jgi:hypothetical protein